MGKNKNNSSTKVGQDLVNKVVIPKKKTACDSKADPAVKSVAIRRTRASAKRGSEGSSLDEQPLPKQTKFAERNESVRPKEPKKGVKVSVKARKRPKVADNSVDEMPGAIVASARSLITSIKSGAIGNRGKNSDAAKSYAVLNSEVVDNVQPSTSKRGEAGRFRRSTPVIENDRNEIPQVIPSELGESDFDEDDDNVKLHYTSEEEYAEDQSGSPSHSKGEYSSSSDGSLDSSESSSSDDEEIVQQEEQQEERERSDEPPQNDLDRNDPRVKKLLAQLMREEREKSNEKGNTIKTGDGNKVGKVGSKTGKPKKLTRNGIERVKSPSDTTLYAPALFKENSLYSPANVVRRHISTPLSQDNINEQISSFIEGLRPDEGRESHEHRDRSRGQSRDDSRSNHKDKGDRSTSGGRGRSGSHSRSVADDIVLQAERFKASIEPPTGIVPEVQSVSPGTLNGDSLHENVRELLTLLKSGANCLNQDNSDDDFFHVTCHLDSAMKTKIANGEYVDLERLLPKTRYQVMSGGVDNDIEVIRKNGSTYILPEGGQREVKITSVRHWEQAFRVYSAVYSQAHPDRAAEIWQYVHIINTAALSYAWENVSFYDVTFRQLMEKKP